MGSCASGAVPAPRSAFTEPSSPHRSRHDRWSGALLPTTARVERAEPSRIGGTALGAPWRRGGSTINSQQLGLSEISTASVRADRATRSW